MGVFARGATPGAMRKRSSFDVDGIAVIVTLATIALSLRSIFTILNTDTRPDAWSLALLIASVPLGWLTLHTVAAFHYVHLYYDATPGGGERHDTGGLAFPGDQGAESFGFPLFLLRRRHDGAGFRRCGRIDVAAGFGR